MSRRFVMCAVWAAISSLPSVLHATPQTCEALVAVSYLGPSFDAASARDKDAQHRLNADVLKALAKTTQLKISIDSARGNKALAEVHSGRADLIVGIRLQSDIDAGLDYLKPAYAKKIYRVWRRAGEQLSLAQWPELAGLRGVRAVASKQFVGFDVQANQYNWPMRSVDTLDVAIDSIMQGRADYVLAEQTDFQHLLFEKELTHDFEFIEPPVEVEGMFVALSKDSACNNAPLRAALNKALMALSEP